MSSSGACNSRDRDDDFGAEPSAADSLTVQNSRQPHGRETELTPSIKQCNTVDDLKHVQLLIVFKHPDPAGRNPADPDICRMYDIRHFRNSEPDSGTPLKSTAVVVTSSV